MGKGWNNLGNKFIVFRVIRKFIYLSIKRKEFVI